VGEDSGFEIGLIDADAERTFVTSPGTESRLTRADLDNITLLPGDAVYVSGYDLCYPVSGATLESWLPDLPPQTLLVLDPGPLAAEIPAERLARVLGRVNMLSLNAREARLLTGRADSSQAALQLVSRLAPGSWVMARAGAEGCWVVDSDQHAHHLPARPTHAIDTTGAGDAHVAALLTQLASGHDMYTAAHIANIAASISVERSGPGTGPTRNELVAALSKST
jgi:sugar/nucleoside kinase (ribokinase family)